MTEMKKYSADKQAKKSKHLDLAEGAQGKDITIQLSLTRINK